MTFDRIILYYAYIAGLVFVAETFSEHEWSFPYMLFVVVVCWLFVITMRPKKEEHEQQGNGDGSGRDAG